MTVTAAPAVALEDVSLWYGSFQVLDDVSILARNGEVLGLLGTNGAGKSSVLRVMTGLAHPRSGRVVLGDTDVTALTADARLRRGLALVPGGRAVFPELSVRENLELGGFVLGTDERAARIERELNRFPVLRGRDAQAAGSLSGGQQQQLAIAKALLTDPAVLCIDELSLGLAPTMVAALLDIVREVNDAGVTCIIVEQSLNIAVSLCERAVYLEKGTVRFEGSPAELLDRGDLARAVFLGDGR